MATSFKKKSSTKGRPALPLGSRPSIANNQLLISTGVPSLDSLLGGGLAIGTLLLVEEDTHQTYSSLLHRYFIAEGATCKHQVFIASADRHPNEILKEIPLPVNTDTSQSSQKQQSSKENQENDLQIAWRYKNMPNAQITSSVQFGHYFDLLSSMTDDMIGQLQCKTHYAQLKDNDASQSASQQMYRELLRDIASAITEWKLSTVNSSSIPNLLRISIQSLGSPLWHESMSSGERSAIDSELTHFLLALRSLVRSSYAAVVLSVPTHLFMDDSFTARIQQCCDFAILLDSFAGSDKETNPLYKEYHGLIHVSKMSRLNSISGTCVDTSDLAFKLKRKKFAIEKLHLPPDVSETVSRSQGSNAKPSKPKLVGAGSLCASTGGPKSDLLDF